jgi:methyl-accepting chemotaxis protein
MAKSIVGPIRNVTHIMQQLSAGNTEIKLDYRGRQDEIGKMIDSIDVFRQNTLQIQAMQEANRQSDEYRSLQRREEMNALASEFENSVRNIAIQLADSVTVVRNNAETMAKSASDTNQQLNSTAKTVADTQENIESVANTADELTSTISNLAQRTNDILKLENDTSKNRKMRILN